MSVTSKVIHTIEFSGDVDASLTYPSAESSVSPGDVDILSLASGANTITLPSVSGVTVKGCTIIPPSGNTQTITLKGVSGDTGILLSKTDPTHLTFDTGVTSFVLTAGAAIAGVRMVWS